MRRRFFSLILWLCLLCALFTLMTAAEHEAQLSLRYDDRCDVTGRTVEIIDAGTPVSYQVGYGIAENTVPDEAVIRLEGDTLIACGIGTASLRIDGVLTTITVEAAPISLLLLIGQSNMRGSEGNAGQSIVCPDGVVYATYGDDRGADNTAMSATNARHFAASALTGPGALVNVEGTADCLEGYPLYALNEAGAGKIGPDSGIAYEWARATGEKVWVVNAAHGGTSISVWQPGTTQYKEAVALFSACEETLRKEIAAGHYTLSHMGYFWCQGCNDASQTAAWYKTRFLAMHNGLKADLAFDHDSDPATPDVTLEFADILLAMAGSSGGGYRRGVYANESGSFFSSYKEMELRGHRVAQLALAADPSYPDIHMVCTLGETWLTMPDGTNSVSAYFEAHYPDGRVDYTTQVSQSESWRKPKKATDVKDSIHYNQIGYNEVGIECARNACILLGYQADTEEPTAVRFVDWTGFEAVTDLNVSTAARSSTLVVPLVTPCYRSKEIGYTLSEGLRWTDCDLLGDSYLTGGTLTAMLDGAAAATVTAAPRTLECYRWELVGDELVSTGEAADPLTRLSGTTENGVFLGTQYSLDRPILLLHDEEWSLEWTMSGDWIPEGKNTSRKLLSEDASGAVTGAMALMVNGHQNRISIASYNGTTHQQYGVALSDYGIDLSDTHVWRLVNRVSGGSNRVYLFVDGLEIAPMTHYFTGSGGDQGTESDWLSGRDLCFAYLGAERYLLDNGVITRISVSERDGVGALHFHSFGAWEHLAVPAADAPGSDRRVCAECGAEQTRENPGVWVTHKLNEHLQALPARFDGETNLWPLLDHDAQYFNGTAWATHSSGLVKSVTFAVEPGDRICATSFGKAGENGHASSNGIRLTFFDAWGVAQTLTPAETYAAFAANGGYIPAPEGAVAVNVPMWVDDESAVLRIINAVHTHEWSAWTEVAAPACAAEGQDMRYCLSCRETEYRDTRITGDPDKILVSDPLPEDYFTGKNIVLIGDSITAGVGTTKRYGEYLAEILGLNVTHKGSSGTGYCSGGAMATNQNLTESNIRNADIISIMLGVNDWNWAVKDGSWNGKPGYYDESQTYYQLGNFDSTDTSTFYGALHSWCHNILGLQQMEGFEDKQFIVITPMITSWNISLGEKDWDQDKQNIHGHAFREYCTAIMEVCAYYEIPVFDANMFSGVYYHSETDNNIAETGGDGVHVNAAGHALLAQSLAEFLLEGYTYETRSVPKGGHSFSDGVCTACRLPGTALDVCGASDHDWGAWEFSWFGPDHLLTAERVCDNNTTHRDTETADTPEDALALLRGLLGDSFRWLVTASYDAAGRMEQILMTNAAEAFDAERFIRFAKAVDVRFFYLDQSFTPIC